MISQYQKAPFTISLKSDGYIATPIIYKGITLPITQNLVFSTAKDNQKDVEIHVVMGENPMVYDNTNIGRFIFDNITPAKRGMAKIEVEMTLSNNLDLYIKVTDKLTKRSKIFPGFNLKGWQIPQIRDPKHIISGYSDEFSDIFNEFFSKSNEFVVMKTHEGVNIDLLSVINVSENEALNGLTKEIEFDRWDICTMCGGLRVKLGTPLPLKCQRCDGLGEINLTRETFLGKMLQKKTCPDCKGRGVLGDFISCPNCKGFGIAVMKNRNSFQIPPMVKDGYFLRYIGLGNITKDKKNYGNFYIQVNISNNIAIPFD